jgi:Flp pilus assembly pilin Flp
MLSLFVRLQLALARILVAQDGQELVEYAIVLFFLTVLLLTATRFLGGKVYSALTTVASSI